MNTRTLITLAAGLIAAAGFCQQAAAQVTVKIAGPAPVKYVSVVHRPIPVAWHNDAKMSMRDAHREINELQRENDALRRQMAAMEREILALRKDNREKDRQIRDLESRLNRNTRVVQPLAKPAPAPLFKPAQQPTVQGKPGTPAQPMKR